MVSESVLLVVLVGTTESCLEYRECENAVCMPYSVRPLVMRYDDDYDSCPRMRISCLVSESQPVQPVAPSLQLSTETVNAGGPG